MSERYTPESELPLRDPSRWNGQNVVYPEERNSSASHAPPAASPVVPYREIKQFKKHMPWLVSSFMVANIVMFVITMYVNNCHKNSVTCVADFLGRFSFQPMKENPLLGPSSSTLEKMGALDVDKVVDRRQVWRLFTCIWLHGGVFHIVVNMLSLLVIGIPLEQEFGYVRIGLIYIISGLGGSLLSALFIQTNISVGASGALFGLLGSMLSELIINWTIYENKFSVLVTLVVIIALNLALGILPHVDNFAHIGGFLSGFLLGFIFLIRPHFGWVSQASGGAHSRSRKSKFKKYQWFLCIASLIILLIWFVGGMIMLLRDVNLNDHCSWCHHLSCIDTSLWSCDNQSISCLSEETANQLKLTCSNNNRTETYDLANQSTSKIQGLCTELCR